MSSYGMRKMFEEPSRSSYGMRRMYQAPRKAPSRPLLPTSTLKKDLKGLTGATQIGNSTVDAARTKIEFAIKEAVSAAAERALASKRKTVFLGDFVCASRSASGVGFLKKTQFVNVARKHLRSAMGGMRLSKDAEEVIAQVGRAALESVAETAKVAKIASKRKGLVIRDIAK